MKCSCKSVVKIVAGQIINVWPSVETTFQSIVRVPPYSTSKMLLKRVSPWGNVYNLRCPVNLIGYFTSQGPRP